MPRGLSQIAYPGTRGSGVLNEFPWVLIGVMCFFAGTGGVWAFSERIAVDAKLTPHEIGLAYTVAVVMTTLAPIAAHFSQKNWGYKKPVVISLIALTLVSISIGYTFSYHMFFVAMMMFNFLYVYLLPFYRSLTAILDPSGRIPAMSIAIQCISAALGPFLASIVLLAGFGYPVVSICCGIVVLLSLAFVLGVAQKSDETKSMAYKGL
jgi:MFS family permease